jgi:hypothetical protein
LNVS